MRDYLFWGCHSCWLKISSLLSVLHFRVHNLSKLQRPFLSELILRRDPRLAALLKKFESKEAGDSAFLEKIHELIRKQFYFICWCLHYSTFFFSQVFVNFSFLIKLYCCWRLRGWGTCTVQWTFCWHLFRGWENSFQRRTRWKEPEPWEGSDNTAVDDRTALLSWLTNSHNSISSCTSLINLQIMI